MSDDAPPPTDSPYGATRAEGHQKAVWSLVLGVLSLLTTVACGLGVVVAIPAIYFGWRARRENGGWMATTGLATGVIAIALFVVSAGLYVAGVRPTA